MSEVVDRVKEIVEPILEEHSFYLYDIEFLKENKSWYLRVYIDKKGGVTIDDCVIISDELSEKLDEIDPDPIPQAYYLEVSSPGAERALRNDEELKQAIGEYVHVSFYQQIDGNKFYEGTLEQVNDDNLVLSNNNKKFEVPKSAVAKSRLAIKF
ncbi:ribosome maturation factor RimP [Lentilactobacillus laojiaonis]|uniref:ribosome maturation factor RimP n=1 Tax=Lentilactobacillus laojiaonis TaxID=2883998 RepID=UPI001D0AD82E|nr:ribosome maturation factor RimP [Lentilactobacillus laojiaonis]UDM31655.1 ribosome maturation factor RimP [Lentilactobacillus laojiaonis]